MRNASPIPQITHWSALLFHSLGNSMELRGITGCVTAKTWLFPSAHTHIHSFEVKNGMKKTLLVWEDVCIYTYNDILGNMCIEHVQACACECFGHRFYAE